MALCLQELLPFVHEIMSFFALSGLLLNFEQNFVELVHNA